MLSRVTTLFDFIWNASDSFFFALFATSFPSRVFHHEGAFLSREIQNETSIYFLWKYQLYLSSVLGLQVTFVSVQWQNQKVFGVDNRITISSGLQAACVPHILSGNDVIIAAETGSGKTHGYLVPLTNKLCATSERSAHDADQLPSKPPAISLVLCPNVMLCEQVVEMANSLCDDHGKPLLKVSSVCGRQVSLFLTMVII